MCSDRETVSTKSIQMNVSRDLLDLSSFDDGTPSVFGEPDRFEGVIQKVLDEIRNESAELSEANLLYDELKAKYNSNRIFDQQFMTPESTSGKAKRKSRKHEYREKVSPYSTGSSTPATIPQSDHETDVFTVEVNSNICPICQANLCNKQYVKRHIAKVHADYKVAGMRNADLPFKCPLCPMSFSTNEYLSAHQRRHGAADKYECPKCQKCYKFSNEFKKHMVRVHQYQRRWLEDLTEYELEEHSEKTMTDVDKKEETNDFNNSDGEEDDDELLLSAMAGI